MKVEIGPYPSWSTTRNIESFYYKLKYGKYDWEVEEKDRIDRIFEFIVDNYAKYILYPWTRLLNRLLPRVIRVEINDYDTWNLDNTLALIIAPSLKKFSENLNGSPDVDHKDLPKKFKGNHMEKWQWIIGEMTWAFEQAADDYGHDQFRHNLEQFGVNFVPVEGKNYSKIEFECQKDPSKPAYYIDYESQKLHDDRIQNGFRLFAKYYRNLWD